ncbi:MAG: 30S ribosomal protein S1 [Bdellovibrionaceae bacterium]|nr:30S ribosomal protein S1 [Pseudobdellovibrionaceae bacterium]
MIKPSQTGIYADLANMLDKEDANIAKNPQAIKQAEFTKTKTTESFESLFKEDSINSIVDSVVMGKVINITDKYVVLDIGYKSEGLVPNSEFSFIDGVPDIKVGDPVEVYVSKSEDKNGMVVLSKDRADMMKAWDSLIKAAENEEVVEGVVLSTVKGGLNVDIGVKAFLPGSQIELYPVKDLAPYVGQTYKLKIIKFNQKRGNIVLSRRALLEASRETLSKQSLEHMEEGQVLPGIVKNITNYGAFIDLGGIDGLIHVTDMSWSHIKHPSDVLTFGEKIQVKILKLDKSKGRVNLGLKQLQEDPWAKIISSMSVGDKVKGKVLSITDYGCFVNLEEGVEGLIHTSEVSWDKKKNINSLVTVGQEVEVMIVDIDKDSHRISLSLKRLQENPWKSLEGLFPVGTIIEGKVTSITDFGVFISLSEEMDGLVHISEFSWTKRVDNATDIYSVGDLVKAVVLGIDTDNGRVRLGIKQLEEDPWNVIDTQFPIGSQHELEISRIVDFGAFAKLTETIEGMIHISELSAKRIESPSEVVSVGDKVKVEVVSIDKEARRISLSIKLAQRSQMREETSMATEELNKGAAFTSDFGSTLQNLTDQDSEKDDKKSV